MGDQALCQVWGQKDLSGEVPILKILQCWWGDRDGAYWSTVETSSDLQDGGRGDTRRGLEAGKPLALGWGSVRA